MVIEYQPGRMNSTNNPSRYSDYEKKNEHAVLAGTLQGITESVS